MACVIVKYPDGSERKWPEGRRQSVPGEQIIGVDWACDGQITTADTELSKAGLRLGDAIAWATKRLGIKQCAPCKARQEILNAAQSLGWAETLRQIRETL